MVSRAKRVYALKSLKVKEKGEKRRIAASERDKTQKSLFFFDVLFSEDPKEKKRRQARSTREGRERKRERDIKTRVESLICLLSGESGGYK